MRTETLTSEIDTIAGIMQAAKGGPVKRRQDSDEESDEESTTDDDEDDDTSETNTDTEPEN